MKGYITLFVFFISIAVSAQSKNTAKLYSAYDKGKYKKSEKLAKKMLAKESKDIDALYILGLIDLRDAKKASSYSATRRSILYSIEMMNRMPDPNKHQYKQLNDSIHNYVLIVLSNNDLKKKQSNIYLKLLANEFNDKSFEYNASNTTSTLNTNYLGPQDSLRRVMLSFASELEGSPYKWAGINPKTGFDCSGFTMYVYKSIGIELPHNAQKQSELIKKQKPIEDALPGDLIFFGSKNRKSFNTQHAGIIYSKEGEDIEVIHCSNTGVNIEGKDSSWDRYWIDRVLFVIDILSYNQIMGSN